MQTLIGARFRPRLAAVGAAAAGVALFVVSMSSPASGDTPGCESPIVGNHHCFSVLLSTGVRRYGMYGTWNRAPMTAGANSTNKRFVDSEMWLVRTEAADSWIETGLTAGWLPEANEAGYHAFVAYQNLSGIYKVHSFGSQTPDTSVTDEFQISRGSDTNTFRVYFDGKLYTTPAVGFWSGLVLQYGGEVATEHGTSWQFYMRDLQAITSTNTYVGLDTQTPTVENPPLTGSRPADSEWNWRIPS